MANGFNSKGLGIKNIFAAELLNRAEGGAMELHVGDEHKGNCVLFCSDYRECVCVLSF